MTLPDRQTLHDTYYNNKANFPSIASATGSFWASDESPSSPQAYGRHVDFTTGDLNGYYKNYQRRVLCVGN